MRIIAFAGPKGCGKDTAARHLLARNSILAASLFQQVNFADPLKAACGMIFGFTQAEMYDPVLKEVVVDRFPYKSPREVLQNVAKLFRTMYDPAIWVYAWERKVKQLTVPAILVTDLRHVEELETLKAMGATIYYVMKPDVEEARKRGIHKGDPLWTDPSEAYADVLKAEANAVIQNDGTLDQLYSNVAAQVQADFGDIALWPEAFLTRSTGSILTKEQTQQQQAIL